MIRIPTSLVLKATNEPVDAYLIEGVSSEMLERTELAWAALRIEGARKSQAAGLEIPQHWHWDWRRRSRLWFKKYIVTRFILTTTYIHWLLCHI